MLSPDQIARWDAHVAAGLPEGSNLSALAASLQADPVGERTEDRLTLASCLAHCAFAAPDRIAATYDAITGGWLGPVTAAPIVPLDEAPLPVPEGLNEMFWGLVSDAALGRMDAIEITTRSAGLGGLFGSAFQDRVGRACLAYPGVTDAAAAGIPPRFTLEALAACPDGSLGNRFYRLITENGFDLEVLDRDALGLDRLPYPIGYLNTRALQCHDLWHIAGGYETTALHEIAISGFQMAQFGHSYSSMFLAVVSTVSALSPLPGSFNFLMDVVLGGWRHGRQSPAILGLRWEDHWHLPVETLRAQIGLEPFASPYPADIIEQSRAALAA